MGKVIRWENGTTRNPHGLRDPIISPDDVVIGGTLMDYSGNEVRVTAIADRTLPCCSGVSTVVTLEYVQPDQGIPKLSIPMSTVIRAFRIKGE